MIRTYDNTGNASSYYKLYSWDNMEGVGVFDPTAAAENASPTSSFANWASQPDVFTDLNQPLNGTYPIISGVDQNGNPLKSITTPDNAAKSVLTYESNGTTPDVEGFWIDPASTPTTNASDSNSVPMPVKWLYLLPDGTLVPGTPNPSGTGALVAGAAGKRILGRIAFWTDDETAKVNINTASEGIYWDVPVCASQDELNLATNPPVENEFQRTPGHPATTCLSSVFTNVQEVGGSTIDLHALPLTASISNVTTALNTLYNFAPRLGSGGSQGGTYPMSLLAADAYTFAYAPSVGQLLSMNMPGPITPKADRLFDNVDEALFQNAAVTPGSTRTLQDSSLLTKSLLQQDKFFLTANSRAPEVTLFNTPRISLWPITWPYPASFETTTITAGDPSQPLSKDPWMVAKEQLLAFCSTLSGNRYFFQRQNPDSPTYDYDNIARNQDLLGTYLRTLMAQNIPGIGSSFNSKFGQAGSDYLLVNAFDFIRGGVNLSTLTTDSTGSTSVGYNFTGINYRTNNAANSNSSYQITGNRQVPSQQAAPMNISLSGDPNVKGFGQFPTITQGDLIFYATQRNEPTPGVAGSPPTNLITSTTPQTTQMQMVLYLYPFLPSENPVYAPTYWIKVQGSSFQVNGNSIGFPSAFDNVTEVKSNGLQYSSLPALLQCFQYQGLEKDFLPPSSAGGSASVYQLVSNFTNITGGKTTFTFTGTPITVQIYAPNSASPDSDPTGIAGNLVQTINMDFSQCNGIYPVPLAPRWVEGQQIPPGFNGYVNCTAQGGSTPTYFAKAPDPEVSASRSYCYAQSSLNPAAADNSPGTGTQSESDDRISPLFKQRIYYGASGNPPSINSTPPSSSDQFQPYNNVAAIQQVFGIYDTIFGLDAKPNAVSMGDGRVLAGTVNVPSTAFQVAYSQPSLNSPAWPISQYPRTTAGAQRHTLSWYWLPSTIGSYPFTTGAPLDFTNNSPNNISIFNNPMATWGIDGGSPGGLGDTGPLSGVIGGVAFGLTASMNPASGMPPGDFNNGSGNSADGGIISYPDQSYQALNHDAANQGGQDAAATASVPYFSVLYNTQGNISTVGNYFSPSRQIASPVAFGSIPEPVPGTSSPRPWTTLLFCPNPVKGPAHPGFGNSLYPPYTTIPDHLFLDLFWMPVVEPYPISEAFSTAGKVNLNYQIVPFTYVNRETGLYAVMKSTKVTAIPSTLTASTGAGTGYGTITADYKNNIQLRTKYPGLRTRFNIDTASTLQAFDAVFARNDLFRSASQICDIFLVPKDSTDTKNPPTYSSDGSAMRAYWGDHLLTGANSRESPYNQIYPRVTTKSNTFQVHFRVQVVTQTAADVAAGVFDSTKSDSIGGEYRGSSVIERYIDPSATIPDLATAFGTAPTAANTLDAYYKFRILNTTAFNP